MANDPMVAQIHRNFIRFLVQKTMFCPITGNVLDMDTCTVVLDSDGDPAGVFDPSLADTLRKPGMLAAGYTVMDRG